MVVRAILYVLLHAILRLVLHAIIHPGNLPPTSRADATLFEYFVTSFFLTCLFNPSQMHWLSDPNAWASLLTLTALEIVLGIDNIIFISILSGRLGEESERRRARKLGLTGALLTRLALLFSIVWIMRLDTPVFSVAGMTFTGRELILLAGGAFLIGKATREIHHKLEPDSHTPERTATRRETLSGTVLQIMALDVVFSLDSVITAVGMADLLAIMVAANVLALGVMLFAMEPITSFVDQRPTVKMLALAFLVLIGTNLVAEGFGHDIPKGYIYTAMAFSLVVELLNGRARSVAEAGRHSIPPGV